MTVCWNEKREAWLGGAGGGGGGGGGIPWGGGGLRRGDAAPYIRMRVYIHIRVYFIYKVHKHDN